MPVLETLTDPHTRLYFGPFQEEPLKDLKYDLIIADPPYNIDEDYKHFKDTLSPTEFAEFLLDLLLLAQECLTDRGNFWLVLPNQHIPTIFALNESCGDNKLLLIDWCIWHYRFGQCVTSKFISSHVHLLRFSKSKRPIWNPNEILVPSDRAEKYNDARTKKSKTPGMRVPLSVWEIPRVTGNSKERRKEFPNQLPSALIRRIILSSSNPDSVILDPCLGSGTTVIEARKLNRASEGIELSRDALNDALPYIRAASPVVPTPISESQIP